MRCIFSVIIIVFIQLISLQYVSGKTSGAAKKHADKKSVLLTAPHYKLSKKQSPSFKRILFEDLPFVHSNIEKPGFNLLLWSSTHAGFTQIQVLISKNYRSFLYRCHSLYI